MLVYPRSNPPEAFSRLVRCGSQPGDWPLRDGLAMIKAGVIDDEAIKEALSVFTPPEAQLAEADPAGQ